MGFMDEYNKALKENVSAKAAATSGSAGVTKTSGGSTPNYVGAGHESFYSGNSSKGGKTFDAPIITTRVTGKKKKKKEKEKRSWFKKGAFEDGYDFGDISKTILGTAGDVVTGAVKGFSSGVEGIADLGGYGVAGILDVVGRDDYADIVRDVTVQSQTNQIFGGLEETADKYSILGDKVDSVIDPITQALGYIGMMYATAGIGAAAGVSGAGATALTTGTMFASSAGGAMGEAYQGGASDEEALKHGVMKGAVEAGSELIFGGLGKGAKALGLSRGLSSLDDIFAKKLSSKISNHFWKTAAQYGVKASAEGVEEVLAGLGSAVSKKLTYMSDEDLSKLIKDENLLEQFAVGTAASAIMQSGFVPGTSEGSIKESITTGRDFISGLSQNEQKVVDKLYKDEIASREKEGKVSQKEKDKIYDSILEDMEKGYISTDTIEEVLGGEKYSQYKQASEWEDSLQTEFDKLNKMKQGQMTGEQVDRREALRTQLKNVKATSSQTQLKSQIRDEVMGLVKGDRLAESYNESARTGQKFEADVTKYDAKQQAVVQKAIDSGILNNSNRTHEFVDFVSKISADTGVLFDFSNTAKIREAGFAVEGQTVDGFITKDGITVNIDSPKSRQFVVGHEITHALEGTELYDALRKSVFDYAKMKNQYGVRMESIQKRYKEGTDFEAELTADLVGEYIFSDTDFINNLSTQNRNVFQKVYDEIKYLCKVATAGSKEARELEKVKRAFEKAYREGGKAQGETKYSVSDKNIKDISTGYSHGESYYTMSYMQDGKTVGTLQYGEYDGEANVKMIEVDPEYRRKGIATKLLQELQNKYEGTEIDFGMSTPDGTKLLESITYDVTDEAVLADRQKLKDLQTELNDLQEKLDVLYDTENLTEEQETELHNLGDRWQEVYESIHELAEQVRGKKATRTFVKTDTKYSLSDSTGKQLTKEQQDYFKDSKARDENGSLKLVYHSSPTAGFTVFDGAEGKGNYKYADYGDGITFFTDNKDMADSYSPSNEKVDTTKLNSIAEAKDWLGNIGAEHLEIQENNGRYDLFDTDEEELVHAYYSEEELLRDVKRTVQEEYGDIFAGGQYEGYLNMKNPMVVDAEGRFWDRITEEFSQEVYDKFQSLTAEEKAALEDLAGWEDASMFVREIRSAANVESTEDDFTRNLASAFNKLKDSDNYVNLFNLFDIASDGFTDEAIRESATVTLSTNDYVERALQDGSYDGVIIKNVVDYGGHAMSNAGSTPGNDYIVFNSNQFKAADNLKPTEDADIRFSLSEPVEKTKDLVALHNLTTDKLMKSLELGGLPMPSLAVTKADIPHSNFGEITLIFGRETIDPKANRKNKVYSADAWTPVFPRTEYESDINVERRISQRLSGLESKIDDYFSRDLRMWQGGLEDYLNREGGEEGLVQKALRNYGLKAAYLEEQGNHIDKVTKQEQAELGFNPSHADKYQQIMDILGVTTAEEIGKVNLKDARDNHGAEIETLYPGFTKSPMRLSRLFSVVKAYIENKDGKVSYKTVTDGNATQQAVDDALDSDGYEAWIRNLFSGIVKDSGIYNNKELFTPSGNRRTFKQTHLPVTLENIVKAMASQNSGKSKNVSGFNGIKTLRASTAETFKSVAQMHQRKGRLQNLTQEQFEALTDDLESRLYKAIEAIDNENGQRGGDNSLIRYDVIGEILTEIGESGKYTAADIQKTFRNYSKNVSDDTAVAVKQLLDDVAQMPVNIFEAKPERVVGFDEAKVFVIPYDADVKLKQELLNKGYSIAEYDPKVEGDRQRVVNQFEEFKFSLSNVGEQHTPDSLSALRLEAPVAENATTQTVAENATVQPETQLTEENSTGVTAADMQELFPNNAVPVQEELDQLIYERDQLYGALEIAVDRGSAAEVGKLAEEYEALNTRIKELESKEAERTGSLTDEDVPPEMDAPVSMKTENYDPWANTTIYDIDRSTRTYSDRNPGARRFLEEAALGFGYDVNNSTHGEKWYNDELYYATGGEQGFGGTSRHTTSDIEELKDAYGYTWDQLAKAADDVVKGEVRSVVAKRVELLCHKRLMEGYTDVDGRRYEPNQEYITFLNESFVNENRAGSFDSLLEDADQYAPPGEDVAPVKPLEKATPDTMDAPIFESKDKNAVKGQTTMFEPEKPKTSGRVARVLTEESKPREKQGIGMKAVSSLVDKGMVFENLSLDTGNMEVQAKYNSALPANTEKKAQYFMENGAEGVKPLKEIVKEIKKAGEEDFYNYVYHVHNVDRMTLDERFGLENMPVYGETYTAAESSREVQKLEKAHPEFKAIAEDVYSYNKYLKKLLVDDGCISQELSDWLDEKYPHYVPIRRVDENGKAISVPLDTNKTGVNTPLKRATGGSSDIEPLITTMAMRAEQTFSAIARNRFGIELKNTLGTTVNKQKTDAYEVMDSVGVQEDLLKQGIMGGNPTFTVFENGERVEFEITEDMYDALKPAGKLLGHRNDAITKVSNWRRNLLTTWNPVFALYRNPVKDLQDVMINSQHPAKTYAKLFVPTKDNVIWQIASHGKWAAEYESNGGKGSTYFDSKNRKFKAEDNIFKKTIGFPLRALENAGEFIEEVPRLAEYIASRKEGRSIDRSMLDAARVTTNFAAGGDATRFANAHGFTFLNASVQGASQHVRNFREATRLDGMKGFVKTLAKYTLAGIPGIVLNNMLWDDDEEYEELNDYVKQNYYVVAKREDGKFIRIPKGRTAAVMQNALEQMQHLVTGDDEADFSTFYELFMNNIAPNNPIENNILAPIWQAKNNKAWYGDDLVPSRLQKLPTEEQFDESTDSLSRWLGENLDPFDLGPYKINYLMDQYSGGLGDMFLPMMTPEAESGDNTFVGNMLAPWKKEMTTDKVLNNKNPGNFYELKDELDVVSNGKNATEEDKMKSQYLDSVSWEMGDLYAQKREIQNSDLPDDRKYEMVREIQEQINEIANNALNKYNHVKVNGLYSEAGDRRYNKDAESGKWYEIKPKNADGSDNWYYQKEQEVTKGLGISYEEYWNNREEYNYAYDKPGRYAIAQAVGGYDTYMKHYDVLENWQSDSYISADKDSKGNSISGSRKEKVLDYINGLDIDYGERLILYRTVYSSKSDKRKYNQDIIDYLNGRDDISYDEMKSILEELDMEVDSEGNISW